MNDKDLRDQLAAIAQRLERIESGLVEAAQLRVALQHEIESRRQLAEQAAYLLELVGEVRRDLRASQLKG
jgi:hypothetical protein